MSNQSSFFNPNDLEFLAVSIVGTLGLNGMISLSSGTHSDEMLAAIQCVADVLERELPMIANLYAERKSGSVIVDRDDAGNETVFIKTPVGENER